MERPDKLGPVMREIRKAKGIGPGRLLGEMYDSSEKTNYDASFLHRVERGDKEPPDRLLRGFYDIVQPTVKELPEAHLAKARGYFDPEAVGIDEALANLSFLADELAEGKDPLTFEQVLEVVENAASDRDRGSPGQGTRDG